MEQSVNIRIDTEKDCGRMEHSWRYIGYDECNYSYIPEGKELLHKFGALGDAPYFVRTHFMFCTGNCHGTYKFGSTNLYWEDEQGNPVYDFTYYDKIIEAILESGNKPFVELGFMPMHLADTSYLKPADGGWQKYNQYKEQGWTCPPKDYDKWYGLVETLMNHLVEQYGKQEVETWYFELWNEPDIFYWSGMCGSHGSVRAVGLVSRGAFGCIWLECSGNLRQNNAVETYVAGVRLHAERRQSENRIHRSGNHGETHVNQSAEGRL